MLNLIKIQVIFLPFAGIPMLQLWKLFSENINIMTFKGLISDLPTSTATCIFIGL